MQNQSTIELIDAARGRLELSRQALCQSAGVAPSTYSRAVRGLQHCRPETIRALERALRRRERELAAIRARLAEIDHPDMERNAA